MCLKRIHGIYLIRIRRLWNINRGRLLSKLQIWLSGDAGAKLVDWLVSVRTLTIKELESPSDDMAFAHAPTTLAEGWMTLLRIRFRSVTSLVLHIFLLGMSFIGFSLSHILICSHFKSWFLD
jgi:phenylalanine-4-hydroxylase